MRRYYLISIIFLSLTSQIFPQGWFWQSPFNPSTNIIYSVIKSSNVVIKIFDILGNEIETLMNEQKDTGTYEITWYVEKLPSGIYFYRLQAVPNGRQAGSFVETKKMLLLK